MASTSNANFWIKYILVALIVILAAVAVLKFDPTTSDTSISSSAQSAEQRPDIQTNLSKFYQEFRQSSRDPIAERYGDYVIPLELPDKSASQQLVEMGSVSVPPQSNWTGEEKVRTFPKQSTLRTEMKKYVEQEGLSLIWDLNQDFIIRERFQSFNTMTGTMDEIKAAVDSNFPEDVKVYLCLNKRSFVITSKPDDYLRGECRLTSISEFN